MIMAFAWTPSGKDYTNIVTINGEKTDFYTFCLAMGYDTISENSIGEKLRITLGGDIIV